ncbi:caspase family protein [Thiotrichales bacterium HSG1]|nr:caspase family protein [Thiotrichales bacterium HSG1]
MGLSICKTVRSIDYNNPEKVRLALQPYTNQFAQTIPNIPIAKPNTIIAQPVPVNIPPPQQIITDTTPPQIIIHNKTRGPETILVQDNHIISGQAIDESGIATITINGQNTRFNPQGHFSTELQLRVGNNNIRITATDKHNNTAHKSITLARAEPYQPIFTGNYYALVIGINQYQHITNLSTAVNDATEIAQILQNEYGFRVTTLINHQATRKGIIRALTKLNKTLKANTQLLIYYAGHGFYNEDADKAYWIPTNASMEDESEWLIADRITSQIKANPAKQILLVSDSCYSGTLTRNRNLQKLKSNQDQRHHYLQKMLKKSARILIASGGNEPVSDVGGQGHSIFAQVFIDSLKEIELKTFTASELFHQQNIIERVAGKVKQIPRLDFIEQSGHDYGDFIFQRQ